MTTLNLKPSSELNPFIHQAISQAGGWIGFDRFMAMALYEPGLGYYTNALQKFGAMPSSGSDFVTAPELTPLFGQALYAGLRLQAGETANRLDLIDDGVVYGGSVYLTGRTPVGPLTIGLAAATNGASSLWFSVGRPMGHGTILERGIFR